MSTGKIDSSAVFVMFEEIKSKLDKEMAEVDPFTPASSVDTETIAEIKEITQTLENVTEAIKAPQEHRHKHSVDFMSNRVLIVLVAVIVSLMVSLWVISNQRQTIQRFRDNDLKYRYVKMHGKATNEDLYYLENIFTYNRNADSIKLVRKQVERYERLVKEQAEKQEQIRLNTERADQLLQEAEAVKGGG